MTTDPQPCHGDSDCCAELHRKVDRLLELLEDRHKARKINFQISDIEAELRTPEVLLEELSSWKPEK